MRRHLPVLAAVALLAIAGCQSPPAPVPIELRDVPWPALSGMEPQVRDALAAARREVEEAASETPRGVRYGDAGEVHHAYGLLAAAEACYRNALALAAGQEGHWLYLAAVVAQARGEVDAAMADLEHLVELEPGHSLARLRLADLYLDAGRAEEGSRLYADLLAAPGGERSLQAAALVGAGRAAAMLADHAAAASHYEAALEAAPHASRIHYFLATAYRAVGDLERAREHLDQQGAMEVEAFDPVLARVQERAAGAGHWLRRGDAALMAGNTDGAVAAYREAVTASPASVEAHQSLGAALQRSEDLDGAVVAYRRAADLDPESAPVQANLALLLEKQGRSEEALVALRRALELDPGDSELRMRQASLLADLERVAEAVAAFEAVLEQTTDASVASHAHHSLGRIQLRQAQTDKALEHLEEALRLSPKRSDIRRQLAAALAAAGRYDAALPHFMVLVQAEPASPAPRLLAATAQVHLERYREARQTLEEGLRRLPDARSLSDSLALLLATCPDATVRDGVRAYELATDSLEAEPSLERAETVAMALAELGRFAEAADWQRQLIEQARGRVPAERLAVLEARLVHLRHGRPLRAPWLEAGSP